MAFILGYCDIDFANIYNLSDEWIDSTNNEKEFALSFARSYIDSKYVCADKADWDTSDYTTIPDEVQWANARIAERYIQGDYSGEKTNKSGPIVQERVKAGEVETETTYKGLYSSSGGKLTNDIEISNVLSPYCTINTNKTLIRV